MTGQPEAQFVFRLIRHRAGVDALLADMAFESRFVAEAFLFHAAGLHLYAARLDADAAVSSDGGAARGFDSIALQRGELTGDLCFDPLQIVPGVRGGWSNRRWETVASWSPAEIDSQRSQRIGRGARGAAESTACGSAADATGPAMPTCAGSQTADETAPPGAAPSALADSYAGESPSVPPDSPAGDSPFAPEELVVAAAPSVSPSLAVAEAPSMSTDTASAEQRALAAALTDIRHKSSRWEILVSVLVLALVYVIFLVVQSNAG